MKKTKTVKIVLEETTYDLHTTPEKAKKVQNAVNHCSAVLTQLTSRELEVVCRIINKYNLSRD